VESTPACPPTWEFSVWVGPISIRLQIYCLVDGVSVSKVYILLRGAVQEQGHIYIPLTSHQFTSMPQTLDYDHNTYLAVTLSTASHIHFPPSSLSAVHASLAYHGQVGELQDVQLFAVPKADWDQVGEDILAVLRAKQVVLGIDVQVPKQQVKRGGDEL